MRNLKLLDLFSGAGGAAMGYHRAGFEVVGVDIKPQPHYPFPFCQIDALRAMDTLLLDGKGLVFDRETVYFLSDFDVIHASPPCQRYTRLKAMWNHREYPDLVEPTRKHLIASGLPYIIENVPGAPLINPITLCGSMFRLGIEGAELRRHRIFETSFSMTVDLKCDHRWSGEDTAVIGVYGHAGGYSKRQRYCVIGVYGGHGRDRRRRKNGQHFPTAQRKEAMEIDWMTGKELTQAIPPVYTEFIGKQLIKHLEAR